MMFVIPQREKRSVTDYCHAELVDKLFRTATTGARKYSTAG